MLNKVFVVFGIAFGTAMAAVLGVDIYEHQKVAKKIGMAASDLKQASVKDIQQGIVENAVREAADERVSAYVRNVKNEVMDEARDRISVIAGKEVNDASDKIKKMVEDKISEDVSKIDISELKKSARDKAEEKILSKFDGNLDDLLEKFNKNLSNVQDIYEGIANAIKGQEKEKSNGLKFTIG